MKISAKNLPLLIVLTITVIVSLILLYLVIIKHSEVSTTNAKIEEYKKILSDANKKRPAPVTENFKNMNVDAERLNHKTYQIQRKFGKYYRKPLIRFANTLGLSGTKLTEAFNEYYLSLPDDLKGDIVGSAKKEDQEAFLKSKESKAKYDEAVANYASYRNESELLRKFAEYYKELPKEKKGLITGEKDKAILDEFIKKQNYEASLLKKAKDEFIKDIQAITVETVNDGNVHEFILASLGLPRTAFVTYYKGILKRLQNQMFVKKLLPYADTIKDVETLTFGAEYQPIQRQIPLVIRQMMIREDFFRRIKDTKLNDVLLIRELTPPLNGKKVNEDFICFSYELDITGTMPQLRDFVNSLQNAYNDNIMYLIKDIDLKRAEPENIADITSADTKDQAIVLAAQFQMADFEAKSTDKNFLAASYGKPQVGRSQLVKMRINVDTFLFVADQLERVDPSSRQ